MIVTAGAGEALYVAITTLVREGERVLFQDPGFVSYEACTVLAGGRPEGVPLTPDLRLDVEACKEQMDGARVFVLNSPGNPTGTVESEETIRAIVEYGNDHGVTIISDESTNTSSMTKSITAPPVTVMTSSPSTPPARPTP